jgi:hypothetical protein
MNMGGLVEDQIIEHFIQAGHKAYEGDVGANPESNT